MIRSIERVLNLRPGELGRGALLFAYLFLILTTYVVGKVARDALFLARFQAVRLPYADIATAIMVCFVVAGYVRIGRHASLHNLLLGSSLFFASNCALFWVLARYYQLSWLFPVIYVWVGIFGVLAPTQGWTLANYVLTTREARRLFGLVGGGAIAGGIFAGFFSKVVAKAFGTESLLLGMALFLSISAPLVTLIWRQRQSRLEDTASAEISGEPRPQSLFESIRLVVSSRYLLAIAAVIWLSSLVTAVVGWQFKAIAKEFIPAKDALAVFFGNFNFYGGILALIVQLLFTSRALRRFGIGVMLFTVPVALLASSAYMLLTGTLVAAVLMRGSDWVLRYSIDKSSVELLYLPLPSRLKFQVKWFIDTVIWRLGDGLAGVTILVFASYLRLTAPQISWVAMVLIGGWLTAAWVARHQYVATLRDSIHAHRVEVERAMAPVFDRSTAEVLAASLSASDPKDILYALSLFETQRQPVTHRAIRDLLGHPAADVRKKALSILAAAGDRTVLPQVESLLQDPDLDVRTEALLYLAHYAQIDPLDRIQQLGDFADFSIRSGMAAFLARPGETQNLEVARQLLASMVAESGPEGKRTRMEAARLLGMLPDSFDPLLLKLLADPDSEVVREAIRSGGKLGNSRLIPELLNRVADRRLAGDAAEALAQYGDSIIGLMGDHLSDSAAPIEARRELPGVLLRIGSQSAMRVLMEHLLESDTTLRHGVISALNKLYRLHPELKLDTQLLETVLAAEILGHYRSYQILHTLGTTPRSNERVGMALADSTNQEIERIFRLLSLLYPNHDFHSAYIGLQSKSISVHDNALEFLDNVLNRRLRELMVPLFDEKVSVAERARIGDRLVRARMESKEEAVAVLVGSEDPWLRSCGAYAIGSFGLKSLEHELDSCLEHPDPLLRETARQAKLLLQASKAVTV